MLRFLVAFLVVGLIAGLLVVVANYSWLAAEILLGIIVVLGVVGFLGGTFRMRSPWQ
jgi:hypothetical protein